LAESLYHLRNKLPVPEPARMLETVARILDASAVITLIGMIRPATSHQ
jgi:hypothetical protein